MAKLKRKIKTLYHEFIREAAQKHIDKELSKAAAAGKLKRAKARTIRKAKLTRAGLDPHYFASPGSPEHKKYAKVLRRKLTSKRKKRLKFFRRQK